MSNEFKVGLIVFLSLLSFFVAIFFIKSLDLFGSGERYVIQFKSLDNLIVGGHVKLNGGIKIGKVEEIQPDIKSKNLANVHIVISNDAVLEMMKNTKVRFSISSAGLLGEKYILVILNPPKDGVMIKPGMVIRGEEASNMESLVRELKGVAGRVDGMLNDQVKDILNEVRTIVQSEKLKDTINNISSATANFNQLMINTNSLVKDLKNDHLKKTFPMLNTTLKTANTELKNISREIQSLIFNTNRGVNDLFSNESGLMSVTKEGKDAIQNINKLVKSLHGFVQNLENTDTPAGAIFADKNMAKDLKKVIRNLNELTEDLKENPLISTDKSYKPGPF